MKGNGKFTIAAVGDLHVKERDAGRFHDFFAELSEKSNTIALCGDLTNLGLPAEAECLAKEIQSATVPIVAVLGNHDHQSGETAVVNQILREAGVNLLENGPYETDDVGFAGTKGFAGGFGRYTISPFGENVLKIFVDEAMREALELENSLHEINAKRIAVVLHYSPVPHTLRGEATELYPFLGCSRFEETIDRFDVSAIFHGHAHHGSPEGKTMKGTPVYNCGYDLLNAIHLDHPYVLVDI
ncbi:MAG: Calcineurin-like phosphoesterase superfamily domain protein [bacterium ADurb.Bin400]|nr:MAG: Calcineurin-like phosphoesterase superfamily domain protein [bacterium ADurb.Bin400]